MIGYRGIAVALAAGALVAGCDPRDEEFAKKRAEMLNRDRTIVYNTDGCDMLYYPNDRPITVEGFTGVRLTHALGTKIPTVSYCPLSSAFAYFTLFRAGDPLTDTWDDNPRAHNGAKEFWEKLHTDCLEMAMDFCRTNGFERFMSIRMNDTHDSGHCPEHPFFLFSTFKKNHPECLMEPTKPSRGGPKRWGSRTAVDYGHPLVRDTVRKFVRDFCDNYDIEGIELDFCRHLLYFKSVYEGGVATEKNLADMNELMRDIRMIAEVAGRQKGHPILVTARVPDSVGYAKAVGLDIETWLKEKSVDALICSCYFQLNPWKVMADLCHAHGAKMYASLDESRIRENKKDPGIIPGRQSLKWYHGRYAAAMASGADGVYLFNLEYKSLHEYTQVDPRETDGLDKIYFVTDRGSGGYRVWHYMKDWEPYVNMPRLEPGDTQRIEPGKSYAFDIMIGDDFAKAAAKGRKPMVEVLALTNLAENKGFEVRLAENRLNLPEFKDGLVSGEIPAAAIVRGPNRFEIVNTGAKPVVAKDFAVRITYR